MSEENQPKGKAGGLARASALPANRLKEIAKKAAAARWEGDRPQRATHGSTDHPLRIGDIEIPCYVLAEGTRVLALRGLYGGIGLSIGGGQGGVRKIVGLLEKMSEKGINVRDLPARVNSPIRFVPPHGGNLGDGYEATILPDLCAVIIEAHQKNALDKRLNRIAERAAILQHGFATVGIIALVDEATGYQKDRARDALARILEAFVAKELQPWVKKFPAEFYEGMCRLRGLPFDPSSVKRPLYFGHLTNDVVYRRLAPGVWEELKAKSKKNAEGRPAHHLHRMLTPDVGDPRLKELLTKVVTIMQLSDRWADFKLKLDRVVPAYDETLQIPYELQDDTGQGL